MFSVDENGHLTNRDMDKAEMFNVFFGSVFNAGEITEKMMLTY